jgi:cell division GTPase FtsZ
MYNTFPTQAMDAILKMKDKVDTLIVVANDQLLQIVPENTPLTDAFLAADDILRQGTCCCDRALFRAVRCMCVFVCDASPG